MINKRKPLGLILLALLADCYAQEKDNFCYLASGASSVTFTVSEDLTIGSEIGAVKVYGDVGRDITLTIENSDAVVFRNKSLILQKKLDKEGEDGLKDFTAEAVCAPQNDLTISIPIRIIVTDVNDNAPKFQGVPYSLNVSEATVPGSIISQGLIRAVDADQPGTYSTVEYFIERSEFSKFVAFENSLEGTLTLVEKLDFETTPMFNVTIRVQDQGNPPMVSRTNLTIHVVDADDQNPRFLHERYLLNLPPDPKIKEPLEVLPAKIQAIDPDEGLRAPVKYSLSSNRAEYSYFAIDPYTAQVSLTRKLPPNTQLPIVLVVRATQRNDEEKFSLTTLTVASSEFLPHELKFFQREYVVPLVESTPPGQVILRLQTTKSTENNLKFQLVAEDERNVATFSMGAKGEIYLQKSIDYEVRREYILKAFVTDGKDRDSTRINVTILNANDNDPVFEFPQYTFIMPSNAKPGELVGKVKCTDGDLDDKISYSLEGPNSNAFYVNDRGEIRLKNADQVNVTSHMIVVAIDNGVPPRRSTSLVTVRLPEIAAAASGLFRNSALILPAAFGVILGILVLIIITMVFYILKNKKYRNHLPVVIDGNGLNGGPPPRPTLEPNKVVGPKRPPGVENPMFTNEREDTWSTSEHEVAHEGFQRLVSRPPGNSRTPRLPISGNSSRIEWPLGSIPRRVKKLSWEDEFANETALDPDVSVAPYHQNVRHNPKDVTVYF
ncbi:protocadherin Fat 4-like [Galendromus occidentalis]|uniref:Protocadherin Fat 4-like n=1 Tax=Galendromus occidentalis TaxID=34638 RepID=A0AAJ6VXD9_9ACAR|nr:protocadherin Fat 4-like [Galendromus occidentalis]